MRPHHRQRVRALIATLTFALASACARSGTVTRVVHGRPVTGRFISERAYASYLQGVLWETAGKLDAAARAYADTAAQDPESVDAWVRLGAVRCATPQGTAAGRAVANDPWSAFDRAARIDVSYEALWTERARCHLTRRAPDRAVAAGRHAIALDPDSVEAATVLASALEQLGHRAEALRWLDGLVVREPRSREAHHAALDFAVRNGETARAEAARRALAELGSIADAAPPNVELALRDIDDALASDDTTRARQIARRVRLSDAGLALRAVALGKLAWARERVEARLSADPSDGDAHVAALVGADLARDEPALARHAGAVPAQTFELSPLARSLLDELLVRRCGREAAPDGSAAWPPGRMVDPLLDAIRLRNTPSP